MSVEKKLAELNLALPVSAPSKGIYKKCLVAGDLLYVSGHVSINSDGSLIKGKLGKDISDEEGKAAARQAGLAILSSIKEHFGNFDRIKRVIKILGMVNCIPEYEDQPLIINGCSELYVQLWGDDNGKGVRSAVGMGSLPGNVAVEIEAIFELDAQTPKGAFKIPHMAIENKNWYQINNIDKLDSPVLIVFPERVKANIQTAISMVADVSRLRPHVKTNKSAEATQLMLDAGITKFKCATIAEAEMLGIIKAPDVVLAYQPLGPKLDRFIELVKKFPSTKYSCLTDNTSAAKEQANAFAANDLEVPVYVDLNVGMNRTGVIPGEAAIELCKFISSSKGIKLAGLHAYDGHIRNKDLALRTKECDEAFALIEKLKQELLKTGVAISNIIVGGSPTFPIHAKRKVECSPGTFIYWDKGYTDLCPEQDFLTAAVLVTRIISLPSPTRICADLGHKSVAAENEIGRRVFFLNASDLSPVGQSEEHLVCETGNSHHHTTGDVLYGLPYHVCPTVALYERVYTIENGKVTGEWKNIARDRKVTI